MVYTPSDSSVDSTNKVQNFALPETLSNTAVTFPPSIPFNNPLVTGRELEYIRQVLASKRMAGDGSFTKQCQAWLTQQIGCQQ